MYGGTPEKVTLLFDAQMIDYIYEKFGMDTKICPCGETQYTARVDVQLSPTFWAWLVQFAGKMSIAAPESAIELYHQHLKKIE